jgi:hypothetical protein
MLVTKRGLFVAYINALLVVAVISVAVIKTQATVEKRQQFIDFIGLECSDEPDKCGEHGDCLNVLQWDPSSPKICQCHDGWTNFDGYCDYVLYEIVKLLTHYSGSLNSMPSLPASLVGQ